MSSHNVTFTTREGVPYKEGGTGESRRLRGWATTPLQHSHG